MSNAMEFHKAQCAKCSVVVFSTEPITGPVYCSAHKPVGDNLNNSSQSVSSGSTTTNTKEESFMNKVKETLEQAKSTVTGAMDDIKTKLLNNHTEKAMTFKEAVSTGWAKVKECGRKLKKFIKENAAVITIGVVSAVAGAVVTSSLCGAVAVGGMLATSAVLAAHLIAKKKEKAINYYRMLSQLTTANAVVLVLPLALYALVYAGVYITAYGFLFPLSLIVA